MPISPGPMLAAHQGDSPQSGHLQTSGSSEILDGAEAGMKTRIGEDGENKRTLRRYVFDSKISMKIKAARLGMLGASRLQGGPTMIHAPICWFDEEIEQIMF